MRSTTAARSASSCRTAWSSRSRRALPDLVSEATAARAATVEAVIGLRVAIVEAVIGLRAAIVEAVIGLRAAIVEAVIGIVAVLALRGTSPSRAAPW